MVVERVHTLVVHDPYYPLAPSLVVAADNDVYGTTGWDIFKVDAAGAFNIVHSLSSAEGPVQLRSLVVGNDGALYGLTEESTFFRLDAQGNMTKTVLSLPSRRLAFPMARSSDGVFYASLQIAFVGEAQSFAGGVVRIASDGVFIPVGGGNLAQPMTIGADGALYGPRAGDGTLGHILRWDTSGQVSEIHTFSSFEEYYPTSFTLAPNGLLYAVNPFSSGGHDGFIYTFDTTGSVSMVHRFDYSPDGSFPTALTLGADGAFYGMTKWGGIGGWGTVFRLGSDGTFSTLRAFDSTNGDADFPLIAARSGALYGATIGGIGGALVRVTPPSTVDSFPLLSDPNLSPVSALVQGGDCALYGVGEDWAPNPPEYFVYRAFEAGQLCQRIDFAALPDRTLGEPPFELGASSSSTLPVSFSASGSCTVKDQQLTLAGRGVCTITASQPGDGRFGPADEVSQSFDVRFDFSGFLPPVTDPPTVNRVKAGRTVPIRFRLGGDAGRDVLAAGSPRVRPVDCDASAPVNDVAGGFWAGSNRLLHSPRTRAYTYLWKTEKSWAGACQELSLELVDGSVHRAVFRFERPHGPTWEARENRD
ncbi:MAG TPA: choice-of-anchor tandem repeat GloVer-containing protein [Burkholderiales bacterium]|nr:choice-of-anchor tandem repeat GloVer-containing protein [Burkholderiales bacterium]